MPWQTVPRFYAYDVLAGWIDSGDSNYSLWETLVRCPVF
jgi:hypothetical protein